MAASRAQVVFWLVATDNAVEGQDQRHRRGLLQIWAPADLV
jgi:hypothetical protein